jgi:hypothetical protein
VAITFHDIHALAGQLQCHAGEAEQRAAVSRDYYAALHASDHWLNQTPGAPSAGEATGGMHVTVYNKLRHLDRQASSKQKVKGRVLAIRLLGMKARRVTADYKLADTLRPEEIAQHHAEARAYLDDYLSVP